jgi:hypothetical protein
MSNTSASLSDRAALRGEPPPAHVRDMYLDLLKRALTNTLYEDVPRWIGITDSYGDAAPKQFIRKFREMGRDMPSQAHTSIGYKRLDNIRYCIENVLEAGIPGDLIETGVFRGGAVIFMRAVLAAHGITDRTVWAADSFEGLPQPDEARFPEDAMWKQNMLDMTASLETVQENFRRYNLLDDQVRFLPGWFKDTLPTAPIEQLAVLRLDGDYYESTMDTLTHLYPKLAPGGFVIVDDYIISSCRAAIHDFRAAHNIRAPIQDVDGWCIYWQREE